MSSLSSALKRNANPLTPNRLRFKKVGTEGVELSEGRFLDRQMYGVSHAVEDPSMRFGFRMMDGSKAFPTREEAEEHFDYIVRSRSQHRNYSRAAQKRHEREPRFGSR